MFPAKDVVPEELDSSTTSPLSAMIVADAKWPVLCGTLVPPMLIRGMLDPVLLPAVPVPTTATSHVSPGGIFTVCIISLELLPDRLGTLIGVDSTLPPSLPIISLVIANLNPRDLMQLARLGIEVVIARDCVRYVYWFAHAGKESRTRINTRRQRIHTCP